MPRGSWHSRTRLLGLLLLALSLLATPPAVGRAFSYGGTVDTPWVRVVLWAVALALLALSTLCLAFTGAVARHLSARWKDYLALLLATLLSLVLAEGALRVWAAAQAAGPQTVTNLEYSYTFRRNSHGFRDDPFHRDKGNRTRVLLIGDSFVFGSGVAGNHTMDKLLEARDPHLDVWNLGQPGANTGDYVELARQFRRYDPDLLIVSFYVDNDMVTVQSDFLYSLEIVRRLQSLRPAGDCAYPRVLSYNITDFYKRQICAGNVTPALADKARAVGDYHDYYERLARQFRRDGTVRGNLEAILELYPDTPVVLLINPSKYQASAEYFPAMRDMGFSLPGDRPVGRGIQDALGEWARSRGVDYVDVLEHMDNGTIYYHRIDGHYNRQGNALVARLLHEKALKLLAE